MYGVTPRPTDQQYFSKLFALSEKTRRLEQTADAAEDVMLLPHLGNFSDRDRMSRHGACRLIFQLHLEAKALLESSPLRRFIQDLRTPESTVVQQISKDLLQALVGFFALLSEELVDFGAVGLAHELSEHLNMIVTESVSTVFECFDFVERIAVLRKDICEMVSNPKLVTNY